MSTKIATTFGGSEFLPNSEEYQEGIILGKFLAEQGYEVRNGGYYGLMEATSRGVKEAGGRCVGITNQAFRNKPANQFLTQEIRQKDLFDRNRLLMQDSQLFVIQKGSIGTLMELIEIWELLYTKTYFDRRVCLIGGFWRQILNSLKDLPIKPKEFKYLEVYDSLDQFITDFN